MTNTENDNTRTDLATVKAPFDQLTEADKQNLFYWIVEGNSKDELAIMYLQSLNVDGCKALVKEVGEAFCLETGPVGDGSDED